MERRGSVDIVQPGGSVHVAGKLYEPADEAEEQAGGFTSHTFQHALLATGGLMSPFNPRPGRNVHSMLVGPAANDSETVHLTPLQTVANDLASTADKRAAPAFFRRNAAAGTKHFTQVSASWNQAVLLTHTGDVYQWILNDDAPNATEAAGARELGKAVAVDLRSPTVAKPARPQEPSTARLQPGASAAALGPMLVAALCWERALKGCKIVSVACGPQHCLALSDGPLFDVYSWGVGEDGRLGHGDFNRDESVPRVVAALIPYRVTAISAGGSHCAVITMGGVELADLETAERTKLLSRITSQVQGVDAEQSALDGTWARQRLAACMLGRHKSAPTPEQCLGQVWTWGKGSHGRLGHGNETSIAEPKRVQGMVRLTHRAIQPLSSSGFLEGAPGAGGAGGGGGGTAGLLPSIAPARPPLMSAMSASSMTKGLQRVDSLQQSADDAASVASSGIDSQNGRGEAGEGGAGTGSSAGPEGANKESRAKARSGWLRAFNRTTAAAPTPTAASTPRPTGPSSAEAAALLNLLTPYEEARIGLRTPVGGPYSGASLLRPRNGKAGTAAGKGLTPAASGGVYPVLPILKDRPIATAVACGRNFTTVVTADGDVWAWGKAGEGQCGVDAEYLSTLASQHAQQREAGKDGVGKSKLPPPAITANNDLLRPHRVVFPQPQFQHSARDIRTCARTVFARAASAGPCSILHAVLACPWTLQAPPPSAGLAGKAHEAEEAVPGPEQPVSTASEADSGLVDNEPRPNSDARARDRVDSIDAAARERARKRALRGGLNVADDSSIGSASIPEEGQGDDDRFSTFSSVDNEGGEGAYVSVSDGLDPLAWATRAAPLTSSQQSSQEAQGTGMYEIGEDEARVYSLSAGHAHVVACSRDGAVWAWGANHFGQVGVGRLNLMVKHPANVPVQLYLQAHQDSLLSGDGDSSMRHGESRCDPVVGVCAGAFHSIAFTAEGQLLAWGANSEGQLGSGESCEQQAPEVVRPVMLASNSDGLAAPVIGQEEDGGMGSRWSHRPWATIHSIGAGKNFTLLLEGEKPSQAAAPGRDSHRAASRAAASESSPSKLKRSASAPSETLTLSVQDSQNNVKEDAVVPIARSASDTSLASSRMLVGESASAEPAGSAPSRVDTGAVGGGGGSAAGPRRPSLGMRSVDSSHATTTTSGGAERPPPIHKSRGVRYGHQSGAGSVTGSAAGGGAGQGGTTRGGVSFVAGRGQTSAMRRPVISLQEANVGMDGLSLGPSLLLEAEEALLAKMSKVRVSRRFVDELRQGTCGAEWVHQMEGMAGAWAAFASSEPRVQSLWRNGIPPSLRCRVWTLAVGNPTRVTPALFHMCLDRATAVLKKSAPVPSTVVQSEVKPALARDGLFSPVKAIDFAGETGAETSTGTGPAGNEDPGANKEEGASPNAKNVMLTPVPDARRSMVQPAILAWGRESSASLVRMDLLRTFPQLRLFGPPGSHSEGPLHAHVRDVLWALACLRPDIGYIQGMSYIAAAIALHTSGAAVATVPVVASRTGGGHSIALPPSYLTGTGGAGSPTPDAPGSSQASKKDRVMGARSPLQHKYSSAPSPVAVGGSTSGGVASSLASPSAGTAGPGSMAATPLADASPFRSSPESFQPYSRAVSALTAVYLPLLQALRLTSKDEGAKLPTAMIKRTADADTENGSRAGSTGAKQLAGLYAAASPPTGGGGTLGSSANLADLGSPKPGFGGGFASTRALESKSTADPPGAEAGANLLTVADDRYLTFQLLVNLLGHSHIHAFFAMDPGPLAPYYACFDRLLAMKRPALAKHISSCGISTEMYLFGWFQTLFLKALPLTCALRVVDVFLLDGLPHLYKTAVAVLDRLSEYLLGDGSSFEDTIQVLTSAPSKAGVWEAAVSDPMLLAEAIEAVELPPEIVVELEDIGGDPFFYRHVAMASTGGRR